MSDGFWIIAIASLVGISCSIVGTFLVLRRMSMLGDAISHSVLFGIVVAFLLSGSRSSGVMLTGAALVGLLAAYLTNVLHTHGKLQEDASIGVTFTWLFALGVILIAAFADQIDLDQDCVLHGEIAFAPLDVVTFGGREVGPRAFWLLLLVTVADLLFLSRGYRALKTLSFDPLLASAMGLRVSLWHYMLMSFVSVTTVAAFEAVGVILVVAMLVVPANTALLWSRSLGGTLIGACAISIASAVAGYFLARAFDGSISAAVAIVSGAIFVVSLVTVLVRDTLLRRRIALQPGA